MHVTLHHLPPTQSAGILGTVCSCVGTAFPPPHCVHCVPCVHQTTHTPQQLHSSVYSLDYLLHMNNVRYFEYLQAERLKWFIHSDMGRHARCAGSKLSLLLTEQVIRW